MQVIEAVSCDYVIINHKLMIEYGLGSCRYKRIEAQIKPYLFIPQFKLKEAEQIIAQYDGFCDSSSVEFLSIYEHEKLAKIVVPYPFLIPQLRRALESKAIPTYESDIPFRQRWRIDCDVVLPEDFVIAYWDIEVDSRKGIPNPSSADQRLISIELIDSDYNEYFFCDDDERKMIFDFLKLINNRYPVLAAWNSAKFDHPYLVNRCKKLGIDYKFAKHDWVDLLQLSKVAMPAYRESRRLDDMGQTFLGFGKTEEFETKTGVEILWNLFVNDKKRLHAYNKRDVLLLIELDNELQISKRCAEICRTVGSLLLSDAESPVRTGEIAFMRREVLMNPRIVFRKKPHGAGVKEGSRFKGALVLSPPRGFFKNVYDLDFASMYNRIMQSWFISYENIADDDETDCVLTPVLKFKHNPQARVPVLLRTLEAVRNKYKKEMLKHSPDSKEYLRLKTKQDAVKTAILCIYGIFGNRFFRGDHVGIAESVTQCGQAAIKAAIESAAELGFKTLYAHTDGLFITKPGITLRKMIDDVQDLIMDLNERIRKKLIAQFNLDESYYNMELEARRVIDKIYFSSANCYYLRGVWYGGSLDLHHEVKGLTLKHTDMCVLLKNTQKILLDKLIESDNVQSALTDIRRFLREVYHKLFNGEFDDQLVFKRGVQRPLDTYTVSQPHLRAAMQLAQHELFRPGDKVRFVVVGNGSGTLEVAPVINDVIPRIKQSGYKYYWERISEIASQILGFNVAAENITLDEILKR